MAVTTVLLTGGELRAHMATTPSRPPKFHIPPHQEFAFDPWISGKPATVDQFMAEPAGRPCFLRRDMGAPHRLFALRDRRATHKVDPADVVAPDILPAVAAGRRDWADYLTAIQFADEELGRVMAARWCGGESTKTIIILNSENAPAFPRGKASGYPCGPRESLRVSGPGVEKGRKTSVLASRVDSASTCCDRKLIECDQT